ncbi:MAG: DUF1156 domain-containing protein [Bacteroidaceae bacterium]|nr:DUF1156 domain-containing protein [Bacteroidaceae bacterium]MBQ2366630.1 DUF1156 domain-containing protein [Bacteroidaceae bacterium]
MVSPIWWARKQTARCRRFILAQIMDARGNQVK